MKTNRDIRSLLEEKFTGYEADPGADLWPGIEARLRPRRRVLPGYWRWAGVAASVAILLGLLALLRQDRQGSYQQPLTQQPAVDTVARQPVVPQQTYAHSSEPAPDPVQHTDLPTRRVRQVQAPETMPTREREHLSTAEPLPFLRGMAPLAPSWEPTLQNEKPDVPTLPRRQAQSHTQPQPLTARNSLDLNNLTAENVLGFASREISKWADSPLQVQETKTQTDVSRKVSFQVFDLKVTRTTHRRTE
ncbi:MAG: hypothetical protein OHK0039_02300 [Bacteroidia bacterium]